MVDPRKESRSGRSGFSLTQAASLTHRVSREWPREKDHAFSRSGFSLTQAASLTNRMSSEWTREKNHAFMLIALTLQRFPTCARTAREFCAPRRYYHPRPAIAPSIPRGSPGDARPGERRPSGAVLDWRQQIAPGGAHSSASPAWPASSRHSYVVTGQRSTDQLWGAGLLTPPGPRPIVGRGSPDPAPASTDCWARVS